MNRAFKLPLNEQWYTLESPAYPGSPRKKTASSGGPARRCKMTLPPNIPMSRVCVFRFVDQSHTKFLVAWEGTRTNPTGVRSHPKYFPAPNVQELTSDYFLRPISAYGPRHCRVCQICCFYKGPSKKRIVELSTRRCAGCTVLIFTKWHIRATRRCQIV